MNVTSPNHWAHRTFTPEEREAAAAMLDGMRCQDPSSPTFGYYDPKSQVRILVDAAINDWQPPVRPEVAERAGLLAIMVRDSELSPAGH